MAEKSMKSTSEPMPKRKYNNKTIETSEGRFDSAKEYKRWLVLKDLEKAGLISNLKRQVIFELIPSQTLPHPRLTESGRKNCYTEARLSYKADFVYRDSHGHKVVEDVKGFRTPEYKIKRKLMLWIHHIQIMEV